VTTFRRSLLLLALAAMTSMGSVGCVAQRQYDQLNELYRRSQGQIEDLKAQLEEANSRIAALQAAAGADADMMSQLAAARAERDRLAAALADAERRLREAGRSVALPEALDSALMQLAAQHPDLLTYDPALGMVKFRSDMTFALGSTQVRPEAQAVLAKFAAIVRSPAAAGYETRIVGHTDNVPVTNPANRQKFEDNWGLSAFRAIAVMRVLSQAGVQQDRMSVMGYGEQHPVVPNPARGGAEANRRVEIYLVASQYTAPAGGAAAPEPAAPPVAPEPDDRFK
jgi:chemotaxis protein MotB